MHEHYEIEVKDNKIYIHKSAIIPFFLFNPCFINTDKNYGFRSVCLGELCPIMQISFQYIRNSVLDPDSFNNSIDFISVLGHLKYYFLFRIIVLWVVWCFRENKMTWNNLSRWILSRWMIWENFGSGRDSIFVTYSQLRKIMRPNFLEYFMRQIKEIIATLLAQSILREIFISLLSNKNIEKMVWTKRFWSCD